MTVLVIGNATVDFSFEVDHLPAPGETLLAHSRLIDAGGKGLNQAVVARRAGATVVYLAAVGTDANAQVIRHRLAAEGLDDQLLVRDGPTDQSIIYLAPGGENMIVSTADRAASLRPADAALALETLGPRDALLMQGNLGRETTRSCLAAGRRRGARIVLNPAPIAFDYGDLWSCVDVAVVNLVECRGLGGKDDPVEAARRLIATGAAAVVVTLGKQGALAVTSEAVRAAPAPIVAAVDATGAGDVFCGVLVAALADGDSLADAVPSAVAAASLSVTRRGTSSAFPSAAELAALRRGARLATAGRIA
ncbi:MAG: ribokinase [Dongiaceae bacterium]